MRGHGLVLLVLLGCHRSPMGRVEEIRDQLTTNAPKWSDTLAPCGLATRESCSKDIAASIGAPFNDKKPDQVSAATVAVLVARDHRATDAGVPDVWLTAMRKAKGPGADALRLATSLEMSRLASASAHAIDTDADMRVFVRDAAAAIPGACKTYESLGAGGDVDAMPPVDAPDHSACVQHDLLRKDGPGAGYGFGLFRAGAGALALWKSAVDALREGASQMDGPARVALEARLSVLEAATAKIVLKHVDAPAGNTWNQMADEHNTPLGRDAGAATMKR